MQPIFTAKNQGDRRMKLPESKKTILFILLIYSSLIYSQKILTGNKIFEVKWGKTAETFRLARFFEFETWGVRDFWVDNDSCIYVLDTMNKEVKKFSLNGGKLLWNKTLPYHPLYIWELSNSELVILCTTWQKFKIYVLNNKGIVVKHSIGIKLPYSKDGIFLRSRTIGETAILRADNKYIYLQDQKDAVILDHNLEIIGSIFIPDNEKLIFFVDNGLVYPIKCRNFQPDPYMEIFTPMKYYTGLKLRLEKLKNGLEIRASTNTLQRILGIDNKGNIYIQRTFWEQRKSPLKLIVKFNRLGLEISKKLIHYEVIHSVSYPIKVMPNGDIYTQNSDKEKYWIEKYPAEWFDN